MFQPIQSNQSTYRDHGAECGLRSSIIIDFENAFKRNRVVPILSSDGVPGNCLDGTSKVVAAQEDDVRVVYPADEVVRRQRNDCKAVCWALKAQPETRRDRHMYFHVTAAGRGVRVIVTAVERVYNFPRG